MSEHQEERTAFYRAPARDESEEERTSLYQRRVDPAETVVSLPRPVAAVRATLQDGTRTVLSLSSLPATFTVGRDPNSKWRLQDPSVSRKHAVLRWTGQALSVEDLGSTAGTHVDDQPIGQRVTMVRPGQSLLIGGVATVLELIGQEKESTERTVAGVIEVEAPASPASRSSATPPPAPPALQRETAADAKPATEAVTPAEGAPDPSLNGAPVYVPATDAAAVANETRMWDPQAVLARADDGQLSLRKVLALFKPARNKASLPKAKSPPKTKSPPKAKGAANKVSAVDKAMSSSAVSARLATARTWMAQHRIVVIAGAVTLAVVVLGTLAGPAPSVAPMPAEAPPAARAKVAPNAGSRPSLPAVAVGPAVAGPAAGTPAPPASGTRAGAVAAAASAAAADAPAPSSASNAPDARAADRVAAAADAPASDDDDEEDGGASGRDQVLADAIRAYHDGELDEASSRFRLLGRDPSNDVARFMVHVINLHEKEDL
jgi:pSer/pThr/pTyr-binding forkhead associated (FHA) protein